MSNSNKNAEKEMNVVGHLSELRNRLTITAIFFIVAFILGLTFINEIYNFFVMDLPFKLTAISPTEIIWIYFSMAGIVALAGTIPLLTYQIWAFVKPGLTPNERKVTLIYIPVIFLLFLSGLVFGYFMYTKQLIPFLLTLNNGLFDVMFTVDKYFSFMIQVTVPVAFLFELPIVLMFLTSLGIITPDLLKKTRRMAYFILVIISTIITPAPDFILPIIVSIPLILIYEISIMLTQRVYRKKQERHEKFMKEEYT